MPEVALSAWFRLICDPEDKDCINECLRENCGYLYVIVSTLSVLSIAQNEFDSEISDRMGRTINQNGGVLARRACHDGVIQARMLQQFNRRNAAMPVVSAGILGFQIEVYVYCYMRNS